MRFARVRKASLSAQSRAWLKKGRRSRPKGKSGESRAVAARRAGEKRGIQYSSMRKSELCKLSGLRRVKNVNSEITYERRSKNRPQNAARAVFCGGVKVVHRRIFVS
jgi:hypothetical protein